MRYFAIASALCYLFIPGPGYCDELTSEKKAAIKEMLLVSGSAQMGELIGNATAQQMIQFYKKTKPDMDPRAFEILTEEIKATFYQEFIVKESFYPFVYPIFHKHYTFADLNDLIQFYKSPVGRKLVSVTPIITQESIKAGQEWARNIFPALSQKLKNRFKEEGIVVD
jgi:uncharacterized protein